MARTTILVTRPGAAGRALAEELQGCGQPALWLPAFQFGAAPDEAQARVVLAGLAQFDLAIFVSPQAVRATAALLARHWPGATAIAAVGAGTRAALRDLPGADAATVIAPADDDIGHSGSEALWPLLQSRRPRRVLLLRAQSGRDWLAQQLAEAGAEVQSLAVYARLPSAPDNALRRRLDLLAAAGSLASVISSSDAVPSLATLLAAQPQVMAALHRGMALASHPRIAAKLRAAGFAQVKVCAPEAGAIVAALGDPGTDRP